MGAATSLVATVLSATTATVIRTVHGSRGPWVTNAGYEYDLVLIEIVFTLSDIGPGNWSVDGSTPQCPNAYRENIRNLRAFRSGDWRQ